MVQDSGQSPGKRSAGLKIPNGSGIAFGLAMGAALGAALDNLALGIALGAAFGAATDAILRRRSRS